MRTVESFHSSSRGASSVSKRRNPTPSYLLHRQSGRAGARQQKLPGAYDSTESRTAFARLQLELEAAPHQQLASSSDVSVSEVLLAFIRYAEGHYRDGDGAATNEFDEYKAVSRYVRELNGEIPAAKFGPLALKAIRQKFIDAGWRGAVRGGRIDPGSGMFAGRDRGKPAIRPATVR
jgi:hypothetical protein